MAVVGDQFYVTIARHDSVLNAPISVGRHRVIDPFLLKRALEYPRTRFQWRCGRGSRPRSKLLAGSHAHAIPETLYGSSIPHLAMDTMGRDRSYFSHLLRLPAADPADVLRSWGTTSQDRPRANEAIREVRTIAAHRVHRDPRNGRPIQRLRDRVCVRACDWRRGRFPFPHLHWNLVRGIRGHASARMDQITDDARTLYPGAFRTLWRSCNG